MKHVLQAILKKGIFLKTAAITSMLLFCLGLGDAYSQSTVVEWIFETEDRAATGGTSENVGNLISREAGFSVAYNWFGSNELTSNNWNAGANSKYWIVSFSSENFENLTLSSKQRGTNTAPKDWKVQYSVNGGEDWFDVPDSDYEVANDNYITGVLENLELPSVVDDQSEVQIRWIITSNTSINDGTTASGGNSRIIDIIIEGAPTTTELLTSPSSLTNFHYGETFGPSDAQSFEVSGANLDGSDVTVTAPSNFEVSESEEGTYGSSVTLTEFDGSATDIWVRMETGLTEDEYSGDVTITGGGADPVDVSVSGSVAAPKTTTLPYSEDFSTDIGDIYVFSVSGPDREWARHGDEYIFINGFNTGDIEDDWFVLPGVDLDAIPVPVLSFDSWFRFGSDDVDNFLKLLYSTDYAGVDDPNNATWTELSFNKSSSEQDWQSSGSIDLSSISGDNVYIAFQYRYEPGNYREWRIDNILLEESTDPELETSPSSLSNFEYTEGSGPSDAQSFDVSGLNLDGSDVTVTAPSDFEVSDEEEGTYGSTVTLSSYDGSSETIWVRLESGLGVDTYSGNVTISGGGADPVNVAVSGEVQVQTIDPAQGIIFISEVSDNDTGGFQTAFMEIYNASDEYVDMSGAKIERWQDGSFNNYTYTFGSGVILPPNHFLVVSRGESSQSTFETAWGIDFEILDAIYNAGNSNLFFTTGRGYKLLDSSDNLIDETERDIPSGQRDVQVLRGIWDTGLSPGDATPGTFDTGQDLDAFVAQLTGNEGFRILSSPVENITYGEFFSTIWTQGYPGSDYSPGDSNVFIYDEETQSFVNPGAASNRVGTVSDSESSAGKAALVYVFADDNYDGEANPFPKALTSSGTANTGNVTVSLSYNDSGDPPSDGWHLVGNPYTEQLDWGSVIADDRNDNVGDAFYIYDHQIDAYRVIAGQAFGDDVESETDLIAAHQGGWVRVLGEPGGSVEFTEDDISGDSAQLYKTNSSDLISIRIDLESQNRADYVQFTFRDDASEGLDRGDAFQLAPLTNNFAHIFTRIDETPMMVNNLPNDITQHELPIGILSTISDEMTLSWPQMHQVPDEWEIFLTDTYTGERINMTEQESYTFTNTAQMSQAKAQATLNPAGSMPALKADLTESDRFLLEISATTSSIGGPDELPQRIALNQNYPNPFNPVTVINYELPSDSHVTLDVFDMTGRRVATLVNSQMSAGVHDVTFDASSLSSGVYIYRLTADGMSLTRKLTLIK